MKSLKEAATEYENRRIYIKSSWAFEAGARFERSRILGLLRSQPTMQNLRPSIWDEVTDWLEKKLGEIDGESK